MSIDTHTPSPRIRIADSPLSTAPTWTTLQSSAGPNYLLEFSFQRGRKDERRPFAAGTARLVMTNTDGSFSVGTTNVLTTALTLGGHIDFDMIWNGTTYNVFDGFITSIRSTPTLANKDSETIISVSDGFRRISEGGKKVSSTFPEEQSGTRIGNLLDEISWPTPWRSLDSGISTVQGVEYEKEPPMSAIEHTVRSEQGVFYFSAAGVAVFEERHAVLVSGSTKQTAMTTLGTATSLGAIPIDNISSFLDASYITNEARVTIVGSTVETFAESTASKDTYGFIKTWALSNSLNPSTGEATDMAEAQVFLRETPSVRMGEVTAVLQNSTAAPAAILSVDLRDRVHVVFTDAAGGTLDSELMVEGISGRGKWGKPWEWKLSLSPADDNTYIELGHATNGLIQPSGVTTGAILAY